jgi:hypothetical protein
MAAMVEEIARHIPRMRARSSDADFWFWLKGEIDSVRRNAGTADDRERFTRRLRSAAHRHGATIPDS